MKFGVGSRCLSIFLTESRCGLRVTQKERLWWTIHYSLHKIHRGRFKGFQLYAFTFFIGALVLQLTASRWMSIAKAPKLNPVITQHPNWDRVSVPLWPNSARAIAWPPSAFLDGETVEIFANRWSNIAERTLS